jgi:hypothetical protein
LSRVFSFKMPHVSFHPFLAPRAEQGFQASDPLVHRLHSARRASIDALAASAEPLRRASDHHLLGAAAADGTGAGAGSATTSLVGTSSGGLGTMEGGFGFGKGMSQ